MFKTILSSLLIVGFLYTESSLAQEAINSVEYGDDGVVYLEDFEHYETGTIPDEWYNRDGDRIPATYDESDKSGYMYKVMEQNGNKFLRYEGTDAKHLNFPLIDKTRINIHETPILKWDWRIHDIPEGGDEDSSDRNDVAASVYVVFDTSRILFQKVPVSIRYTWSSKYPVGSVFSKLRGRQRIVVIGTGENNLGEWQTVERNIVEDYENIFGKTPPETPIAMLILSDADETLSHTKADYDNFELHPKR
jgi:hypothetical protein